MKCKRHRKSIRLKGYDYSRTGAYFVTICTQGRKCLFGQVADGGMILNESGLMIQSVWDELPRYYSSVDVDAFVVMPNHIHGILILTDFVGAGPRACLDDGQPQGVAPTVSLSDVVHRFKSFTTACYRHCVKKNGWRHFKGKLWQRNYYEHIIRNEDELNRVRRYAADNPLQWHFDRENPVAQTGENKIEEPWGA